MAISRIKTIIHIHDQLKKKHENSLTYKDSRNVIVNYFNHDDITVLLACHLSQFSFGFINVVIFVQF